MRGRGRALGGRIVVLLVDALALLTMRIDGSEDLRRVLLGKRVRSRELLVLRGEECGSLGVLLLRETVLLLLDVLVLLLLKVTDVRLRQWCSLRVHVR